MLGRVTAAAAAIGLALAGTARAEVFSFGVFSVDSDAPAVLRLDGAIEMSLVADFAAALRQFPDITAVVLDSPGGSVRAALLVGGEVEARGIATRQFPDITAVVLDSPGGSVRAALLVGGEVEARGIATVIPGDARCFSACSYIFFAGASRLAVGSLGVHQGDPMEGVGPAEMQAEVGLVIQFLIGLGVDTRIITAGLITPPDGMHVFSPQEIATFGIDRVDPAAEPLLMELAGEDQPAMIRRAFAELMAMQLQDGGATMRATMEAKAGPISDAVWPALADYLAAFIGDDRVIDLLLAEVEASGLSYWDFLDAEVLEAMTASLSGQLITLGGGKLSIGDQLSSAQWQADFAAWVAANRPAACEDMLFGSGSDVTLLLAFLNTQSADFARGFYDGQLRAVQAALDDPLPPPVMNAARMDKAGEWFFAAYDDAVLRSPRRFELMLFEAGSRVPPATYCAVFEVTAEALSSLPPEALAEVLLWLQQP